MNQKLALALILVLGGILLFNNIGGLSIYALDEAKNAEAAREMMERGDLIAPTFNYELRTDKPPLHYYFMMLAYKAFGVNEFAARFFSSLMGLATILIVFFFTRRYLNARVAFFASLTLIASLHYALQFHMAVPDPYLIFFLTAAMMSFFIFYAERKKKYLYFFYLSLALGVLTKGPVALGLPGLSILVFLIFKKELTWRSITSFKPFTGLALILLVAAPWYIAVGLETGGEWTTEFFLKHNLNRYTNEMEGHGGIFLLTLAFVFAGLLPFSVFVIQAFAFGIKNRRQDILLFSLLYAGMIIVFFAFSGTKLPNYTVPAYPFIGMLLGALIDRVSSHPDKKYRMKLSVWVYLVITLAFPIGVYLGLQAESYLSHLKELAYFFLILPAGAIGALYLLYRKKVKQAIYAIAGSFIAINFLFFAVLLPAIDKENPAIALLPEIEQDRPVIGYRIFNPAFIFYLKRPVPTFGEPEELKNYLENQQESVYLITRKRYMESFESIEGLRIVGEQRDLLESPTTVLLRYDFPAN